MQVMVLTIILTPVFHSHKKCTNLLINHILLSTSQHQNTNQQELIYKKYADFAC